LLQPSPIISPFSSSYPTSLIFSSIPIVYYSLESRPDTVSSPWTSSSLSRSTYATPGSVCVIFFLLQPCFRASSTFSLPQFSRNLRRFFSSIHPSSWHPVLPIVSASHANARIGISSALSRTLFSGTTHVELESQHRPILWQALFSPPSQFVWIKKGQPSL